MKIVKYLGLGFVFLWFFLGGITHFTNAQFFVDIMPPYAPFHLAIVYISGVFEIVGALALILPRTRRMAGIGLFILTLAVTPANLHMSLNPELFPDTSETFLTLRLIVQVLLLACIWWSTKPMKTGSEKSELAGAV